MSKTVEYFLAPQSPWAYLGHPHFMEVVKKTGATVLLKPADVNKIFRRIRRRAGRPASAAAAGVSPR